MKTVRFSDIVTKAGRPRLHLQLVGPDRDRALQQAIRSNRVMTVHQSGRGDRADFGKVGYEEHRSGQILLFPKSIRAFAGRKVVGIKYELLDEDDASPSKPSKARKATPEKPVKPVPPGGPTRTGKPLADRTSRQPEPSNVVRLPPQPEDDEEAARVKRELRRVLEDLEQGRQVAAYNRLKRLMHTL